MAVRQPGEKIGPSQRAGVGVGNVDLELRNDDEEHSGGDCQRRVVKNVRETDQVHLVGVDRLFGGNSVAQHQPGEQGAAEHLEDAGHDPARPADDDAEPPAACVGRRLLGHEAQVIDLFAHLRDQRDADGQRGAEQVRVEASAVAVFPGVLPEAGQRLWLFDEDEGVGQHQQKDPQRLCPRLQLADRGDAMGDQRNDDQRADQVAPGRRDTEGELERIGHDRRFEREEDESERGVDQRGDGRADIPEAGAARQQVHVETVAGG